MCIRDRPTNALAQGESAQGYVADPRNDGVLVYVNGDFVPRNEARVSIFDSGFVLGDGIWEGLRLVQGRIISLDAHLDRLYEGATSIALDIGLTRAELTQALLDTLAKNAMTDGAHIRLMVTRGVKRTPNQDPRFVIGQATVVIVAEFKTPKPESKACGLSLFTSTFRTSGPDVFGLRLNSNMWRYIANRPCPGMRGQDQGVAGVVPAALHVVGLARVAQVAAARGALHRRRPIVPVGAPHEPTPRAMLHPM